MSYIAGNPDFLILQESWYGWYSREPCSGIGSTTILCLSDTSTYGPSCGTKQEFVYVEFFVKYFDDPC